MRRRAIIAARVLLAGASFMTGCDRIDAWLHPNQCALSGRPLRPGMTVRIVVEGGAPSGQACCLRCAITHARQTGKTVTILSVTDHASHEQIRPDRAVYVVGGKVTPCSGPLVDVPAGRREARMQSWDRCLPSVVAFAHREDAERFQEEAGGTIRVFVDLVGGSRVVAEREHQS